MDNNQIVHVPLLALENVLLNAALTADPAKSLRERMAFAMVFVQHALDGVMQASVAPVLGVAAPTQVPTPPIPFAPTPQPQYAPQQPDLPGVPAGKPKRHRRTRAELEAAGIPSKPRTRAQDSAGTPASAASPVAPSEAIPAPPPFVPPTPTVVPPPPPGSPIPPIFANPPQEPTPVPPPPFPQPGMTPAAPFGGAMLPRPPGAGFGS